MEYLLGTLLRYAAQETLYERPSPCFSFVDSYRCLANTSTDDITNATHILVAPNLFTYYPNLPILPRLPGSPALDASRGSFPCCRLIQSFVFRLPEPLHLPFPASSTDSWPPCSPLHPRRFGRCLSLCSCDGPLMYDACDPDLRIRSGIAWHYQRCLIGWR